MSRKLGKWIYVIEGADIPDRELIGGKAHSVAKMRALGLNVPPAFVITTNACQHFLEKGALPEGLAEEVWEGIACLEEVSGRTFGRGPSPLLVSVRSGAPISMPGMMDTVLNLGINDETESALAEETGDPAFSREVHRRFYEMYAKTILKTTVDTLAIDADPDAWRKAIVDAGGAEVPEASRDQLLGAISAVFNSWNARRARRYRKHHDIPDAHGTAALVQAMVFGNLDEKSGTGVLFSRNPLTGEPAPYGEYLHRAQGEDVVSGERTPSPVSALKEALPQVYEELVRAAALLEKENRDVQDIEFTVQQGDLYLLQTRSAKRAPKAAIRFAVDLVEDGIIDEDAALVRVNADQVRMVLRPRLANEAAAEGAAIVASGEPACQGIGVGVVVTDPEEAYTRSEAGEAIVLARKTTSPEDVHGMTHARAVMTELGGSTSHAAVVSRSLGVPCVVGCGEETVMSLAGRTVTVDGDTGRIYDRELPVETPREEDNERLMKLVAWATERAPIRVVRPGEEGTGDIFDLDHVEEAEDTAHYPTLLKGHKGAKGGLITTDEGVRAAIDAGLEFIVADHVLPPLITAIHHAASKRGAA